MTAVTHRQYALGLVYLVAMYLYSKGLTSINYYLALPILISTAKYGALFPDLDQGAKDKSIINLFIYKIIILTGGKHRSRHTHSVDITLLAVMISLNLPNALYEAGKITIINKEVMTLLLVGFTSGWVSHIIADMLTSDGVYFLSFLNKKIALVPKRIFGLRFNTGNEWEAFNFRVMRMVNIVLGTITLAYPYLDDIINLINTITTK